MWQILVMESMHQAGLRILRGAANVVCAWEHSPSEVMRRLETADAVIVRTKPFGRDALAVAKCLKVIGKHGTGVDNIDVQAAARSGIVVVYTPHEHVESVAEHVLGLMLALTKRISSADRALHAGRNYSRENFVGVELHGKCLGIVGAGRIGFCVAEKCRQCFSMRVLAYDPGLSVEKRDQVRAAGVVLVSELVELLQQADVVSLHVPLTQRTRNMIGAEELAQMKTSSYLINAARGGIVDEEALHQALVRGQLAGAGIDVFNVEPPLTSNPLIALDSVCATPHIALSTSEALARLACEVARDVLRVLTGKKPVNAIGPLPLPR